MGSANDPGDRYGGQSVAAAVLAEGVAVKAPTGPPEEPVPHHLPAPVSELIGRERELAALTKLLDEHRLVTLTGPGGVGKTRLALELARERLDAFPDGVRFVDLAPLRDPELVAGTLATALGLREQPGMPLATIVAAHLADKHTLLVLDNLEQLLPGAARAVAELLAAAPQLRIVATSRAPLRVRAEHEYPVAPLPIGEPDRLEEAPPPATALFIERAAGIGVDIEPTPEARKLVAAICARLDGLPLAIELAAAQVRLLSLPQLRDRLAKALPALGGGPRDLPERQQTLRDAIDWSVELLDAPTQRLFARLGVFVGAFDLHAAEAVAAAGDEADIAGGLASLLEQSLIRRADDVGGQPRYTMLETVREAARDRLEASDEARSTGERHIQHFLSRARDLAPRLHASPEAGEWMSAEIEEYRAALRFAIERRDPATASALLDAVWRIFDWAGRFQEALEASGAVLKVASLGSTEAARALNVQAIFAGFSGDIDLAERSWREALRIWREVGDDAGVGRVLNNLGAYTSDPQEAVELLEEALQSTERTDLRIMAKYNLAQAHRHAGNLERAWALYEDLVGEAEAAGEPGLTSVALRGLVLLSLRAGNHREAWEFGLRSLELIESYVGSLALFDRYLLLAQCAAREGDLSQARRNLTRAIDVQVGDFGSQEVIALQALMAGAEVAAAHGEVELATKFEHALHGLTDSEIPWWQFRGDLHDHREWISTVIGSEWDFGQEQRADAETAMANLRDWLGLGVVDHGAGDTGEMATGPGESLVLMFTDVVGSTTLVDAVGDAAWRDLAAWHDRTLRELFARHGGREVDHAGDGFFVSFNDISAALDCAMDIQRRLREHRRQHGFAPRIRIGIHAADVIRDGAKLRGHGVHVAARVAAQGSGDEILVSTDSLGSHGGRYPRGEPRSLTLAGVRQPVAVVPIAWQ